MHGDRPVARGARFVAAALLAAFCLAARATPTAAQVTVTLSASSVSPAGIAQTETKPFLRFGVTSSSGTSTLTSLSVNKLGTIADADVLWVGLWRSADGFYNGAPTDTLIASRPFSGGTLTFTGLNEPVSTSLVNQYFVTVTPANGADTTKTVGVRIPVNAFTVSTGTPSNSQTDSGIASITAKGGASGTGATVTILNPRDGGLVTDSAKVQVLVWVPAGLGTLSSLSLSTNGGDSYGISFNLANQPAGERNTNYNYGANSAVYEKTLSLTDGTYALKAQAVTAAGTATSRTVGVTAMAGRGDARLLVRDNSSQLCADCHALNTHSSQYTSTSYGYWSVVCMECHTPHSTTNIGLIREAIRTPNSGLKGQVFLRNRTGDAQYSYVDSTNTTFTYNNICQVCHTQTKSPSTSASRWRNTGNADSHYTTGAGTQSCVGCHSHAEGFRPGESGGNTPCQSCHAAQFGPMNSTSGYHHYMNNANTGYPNITQPASLGGTGDVNRRCLVCHVDHNIFRADLNASSGGRSFNLRTDISTTPTTTAGYTNTDFSANGNGGICLSCHKTAQTKSYTQADSTTSTPVIPFSGGAPTDYAAGSHGAYAVSSTFTKDGSTFNANCSKCHNDTLAKGMQNSTNKFGLHDSTLRTMVAPLGATATDPLEEDFCFRCHTSDTSVTPAGRDYYNATSMSTAAQGIAAAFALAATVGDRVGARIADNTYVTLGIGNVNAFAAFNSTDPAIQAANSGQVNFSRTAVTAASIYPGQQRIAVMSLSVSLQTAGQTAIWSGATFSRSGTSTDAEVTAVQVYNDSGSVAGTFDVADALVGSGTFSAGAASITFGRPQTIVGTTTYYVVVALASSITSGRTMTIGMTGAAFTSGFTASSFPLTSNAWTFSTTAGSVTAAFTNPAAANQNQGRPGVVMSNFTLTTVSGGALWAALRIDRAGTPGSDADVSRVRVYNDRGGTANSFDAGDQELGSGVFSGGTVTVTFAFPQILTTTASRFYLVYDIAPGAAVNDQLRTSLAAASYFSLAFGTMLGTNLPNTSNAMTVIATTAGAVNVASPTSLAPASVTAGQNRVGIETFTLATSSGNALWTALRVDRYSTGTSSDSDVGGVDLYNDTGTTANTFDASDRVVGTGILSGGRATITLTYPQWISTVATRYYIVYRFGGSRFRHSIDSTRGLHRPAPGDETRTYLSANKHVECADCHNPHAGKPGIHTQGTPGTNLVSGSGALTGAKGVTLTFGATNWSSPTAYPPQPGRATYEYEICFQCHSSYNTGLTTWNATWTDVALEFNPNNLSGHPVVTGLDNYPNSTAVGSPAKKGLQAADLKAPWNANIGTQTMMCSDCHGPDASSPVAQGPHGSAAQFMLRGPNAGNWPNVPLSRFSSSWCANCHNNSPGEQHTRSDHTGQPCYACHIVIPHGGKMSRLIGDRDTMPARYAYNSTLTTMQIQSFTKRAATSYGEGDCQAACTGTHSSAATENW